MNPQLSATTPTGIRNRTVAPVSCATPAPRHVRVQDPFGRLLAKSKGSVRIAPREIGEAAEV